MPTASTQPPRRRGRTRRRPQVMSEINVTPFVDVMLVLLIIFMVAAPLLTVGVPVQLPDSAANALPPEPAEPLTISVPADGALLLMEDRVSDGELVARVRELVESRGAGRIYLRADGSIPYARVVQIMGALNAGGFNDLVLVTDSGGPLMDG